MPLDPTLFAILFAAVLRNLAGWIENSFEDGKVEKYEWGRLGGTFLRVGVLGLALYFGFDTNGFESAGIALVGDFGISAVHKHQKKK